MNQVQNPSFTSLLDVLKNGPTDPAVVLERIKELAAKVESHGCVGPGAFGKRISLDDLSIPLNALDKLYEHYKWAVDTGGFPDPLDLFAEQHPALERCGWPESELPESAQYEPKGQAKGLAKKYNEWLLSKIDVDPEKVNVSALLKLAEKDGIKLTHTGLTKHLRAVGVLSKKK